MTRDETLSLLDEIGAAFARHDIDAMVRYFAADGEFVNAIGPDPHGTTYKGHEQIRGYFENLFATVEDVQWEKTDIRVADEKAYAEWHRRATLKSGETQDWLGVDIYTFGGREIVKKDTYIKVVR
ncbi:MAG: nuclear transport factor 2 family protein [Rhodospirillaceae bacterium]|nr:nuclear transport factor 2 family protein [Rhodospirillaceae bacterium]MDD9918567.1 nuclear transport factor 2 family protein [Rhodospirillaceae bacterium]MDD9925987.1 nuclear transport factor 2 family protein [Rhodospirillaceae bacterium]